MADSARPTPQEGNVLNRMAGSIEMPSLWAGDSWLADRYLFIQNTAAPRNTPAPFGYNPRHL